MSNDSVDYVNHPPHYNEHPSGIECIDVTEWFNFNLGNAIKYIWRHEGKNGVEDLQKAAWYIHREIQRVAGEVGIAVRTDRTDTHAGSTEE